MQISVTGFALLALAVSANVSADFISGDMTLRDAIYLYDQGIDGKGSKFLRGYNCDVFQVVLDVTSGYADLEMAQGDSQVELDASMLIYPDRIHDHAAMFSYALYKNKKWKTFRLNDKQAPGSANQVGKGTVFGYCYSTKPDAFASLVEMDKCSIRYSSGGTETVPGCVPTATQPPAPTPPAPTPAAMSELVGAYSQNILISAPGAACSSLGAANGTYSATFNVTVDGNAVNILGYTSIDACHYTLSKTSGDSVSGYTLTGTVVCVDFSGPASVNGLRKSGNRLLGTIVQSAYGCTQTLTLQ